MQMRRRRDMNNAANNWQRKPSNNQLHVHTVRSSLTSPFFCSGGAGGAPGAAPAGRADIVVGCCSLPSTMNLSAE